VSKILVDVHDDMMARAQQLIGGTKKDTVNEALSYLVRMRSHRAFLTGCVTPIRWPTCETRRSAPRRASDAAPLIAVANPALRAEWAAPRGSLP
jgi:Arc/MetJ family transcription regulator